MNGTVADNFARTRSPDALRPRWNGDTVRRGITAVAEAGRPGVLFMGSVRGPPRTPACSSSTSSSSVSVTGQLGAVFDTGEGHVARVDLEVDDIRRRGLREHLL
jgi:hypothetical protein